MAVGPEPRCCPWCFARTVSPICPDCGTATRTHEDVRPDDGHPMTGRKFDDRYRVTRFLDEGGMGQVYAAYDGIRHAMVAMKFLVRGATRNRQRYDRFRQEARTLAQLGSLNVPAFLDFEGASGPHPYIVMELLRGRTLDQRIHGEGPLEWVEALVWLRPVCMVLEQAHALGIVHRDIKPSNVFLQRVEGGNHVVKVLDFGIVHLLAEEQAYRGRKRHSTACGTPEYMSPGQVAGKAAEPADDVYALGVVLFEALTGYTPFMGEPEQIALAHWKTPAPRIQPGPGRPEDLCDLVAAMLEKRPSRRPPGALAVARRMEEILRTHPRPPEGPGSAMMSSTSERGVGLE